MAFRKATKAQAKLRMAITGPSGSGKSYTALTIGKRLGARMACIDTERGSLSKYAGDVADFDVMELDHFSVENYLRAMREAAEAGYDVLVIDSLSHAWAGKGGVLEEVDKRGGKFDAWRHATPMQQKLVDSILGWPGHVIVTMRSKMDYAVTTVERNGKRETKVEKLGLAAIQRDDFSYETDIVLDMNERNVGTITKSRCNAISGAVIDKPGADLANTLKAWLTDGAPAPERTAQVTLSEAGPTSSASTKTSQETTTATEPNPVLEVIMSMLDAAKNLADVDAARKVATDNKAHLKAEAKLVRERIAQTDERIKAVLAAMQHSTDETGGWVDGAKAQDGGA